jgi:hypothetical protein
MIFSARRLITRGLEAAFRRTSELSLALTPRLEEVFTGADETGLHFDLREVPRFSLRLYREDQPRRVLATATARELVWAL